jgi:hypothetical protein
MFINVLICGDPPYKFIIVHLLRKNCQFTFTFLKNMYVHCTFWVNCKFNSILEQRSFIFYQGKKRNISILTRWENQSELCNPKPANSTLSERNSTIPFKAYIKIFLVSIVWKLKSWVLRYVTKNWLTSKGKISWQKFD